MSTKREALAERHSRVIADYIALRREHLAKLHRSHRWDRRNPRDGTWHGEIVATLAKRHACSTRTIRRIVERIQEPVPL